MLKKIKKFARSLTAKQLFDIFFTCLGMFVGIYLRWGGIEVVFFGVFIWIIINPVSSRATALPALFFLFLTLIFILFNAKVMAEKTAIYTYCFLIMSVIMGIYEIWHESKKKNSC